MGAQAVPHRQKDAVQPEGEHQGGNGQHRGPYLEERAGGGIGRHGGGGGVEQVEEVQAGYGGQDARQAHPGTQEQLHHNSFAELAALAEPPQHRAHPGLAAAPEHAPVLLHHPQADGGQNEQNHHAEHHKADQLGIGHGDGQHHLGHVVGADGEAVELLDELPRQNGVGRQLGHEDDLEPVLAAAQVVHGVEVAAHGACARRAA